MEGLQCGKDIRPGKSSFEFGRKRRAEEELENDQRLAKRFNLLNLEHSGRLYFPVERSSPRAEPRQCPDNDFMELENTRDKIYISNLDQELAETDTEEERLIFLPDIEKKLARIPKSVLTGQSHPITSNEVVLYNVPSSISVPREKDNVRRAILETRARVQEKQAQEAQSHDGTASRINGVSNYEHLSDYGMGNSNAGADDDENAMDIG